MATMQAIEDFLDQKRLAVIGVSHHSNDFSRTLFRELRQRGYDVVPVNPRTEEIDGQRCFARMQDVHPPVGAALVMTPAPVTETVVQDCIESGVKRVWMYRGGGKGAATLRAAELCAENGISVIPGECPFMFLPGTGWIHRTHAWVKKIAKTYPR